MAVVATGFFDGVHLGHRHVISTLVSSARERGGEAIVVTFRQHPRAVLQQDARSLRLLTSADEKEAILRSLGVDRIETLQFDREFASMTCAGYLGFLKDRMDCDAVVIGYDTRLGSDLAGSDEISAEASRLGLDIVMLGPCGDVSSTKIRQALRDGLVADAAQMLGYRYSLRGIVVPGKQLGRRLGFPTANLQPADPLKQIPGRGVYLTRTEVLGRSYSSMTNVGDIVETNIFDFDYDIYSLDIRVEFIERIRDMKSFASLDDLSAQLGADREMCRKLSEGRKYSK